MQTNAMQKNLNGFKIGFIFIMQNINSCIFSWFRGELLIFDRFHPFWRLYIAQKDNII